MSDRDTFSHADVIVSDVDLPASFKLWEWVHSVYIGRRSIRHTKSIPPHVIPHRLKLMHTSGGGVTDGAWELNIYVKEPFKWNCALLPTVAKRDLSGVINTTAGHGLSCPAPLKLVDNNPRVVQLRPKTYHGSGLCPFLDRTAYYVVPSVFTATKWCRRHLTAEETLLSLDIGESIISSLSSTQRSRVCKDTFFIPCKSTIQVLQSVGKLLLGSAESPRSFVDRPKQKEHSNVEPTIQDPSRGPEDSTTQASRTHKATKADDAAVPTHLWNDRIVPNATPQQVAALDCLRSFQHRWWQRHIVKEFIAWFKSTHGEALLLTSNLSGEAKRDLDAGRDCLTRSLNSSFWGWDSGSRPYFWRWPLDYRTAIRDGIPIWLKEDVTKWRRPQPKEKDQRLFEGMRKKIQDVRNKFYIITGFVFSLTSFFAVPKGDTDIRMVYDGTKSGFNGSCWAPWFMLPTIEQHLRATMPGSYMGDIDIGEMFLNFVLNEDARQYCGVDLTTVFPEEVEPGQVLWEVWSRCGMGFTFSPFQAVQGVLWAEEFIMGDGSNPANPFNYASVILNSPGMPSYDPWMPWVYKVKADGTLAAELLIYVDDVRVIGGQEAECWYASHWVASKLNYLGLQDAPRKRREPLQEPGAWAGSLVHTTDGAVSVLIAKERWAKLQLIIRWIADELASHPTDGLDHKLLERYRGVLVYISRTYPALVPYLKGIHLTLDSWRPWRKNDGWKMSTKEIRAYQIENGWEGIDFQHADKPPKRVRPTARLHSDVSALLFLTAGDLPPKRQIRPSSSVVALYGFADASGKGFGSSLYINGCIHFRHGQWSDYYDDASSNFRELDNLVSAIEEASREALLDNAELFMFTDNSTAESAFYKGTSSVETLFTLILRLRRLQMTGAFVLHVIHCAGTRMKAQGTDGLSRADLMEGVMRGESVLSFLPLHLSAVDRNPRIVSWVEDWYGADGVTWLTPAQWYTDGQCQSRCVWFPPPAAADVAVELLAKAKHKRPHNEHVVLIPRLMTARWRKLLSKVCDIVITVPVGTDIWDFSLHEPLIVAIAFPLIKHRPWRLKGTIPLERSEGLLRELQKASPAWGGAILRQLCSQARQLDLLSESVVWSMLRGNQTNRVPNQGA